jgi:hypothetical protein
MAGMTVIQKFEALCDQARNTLSSRRFILWAIPLIIATRLLAHSPADPDLFARIAMGHLTLSNASVPLSDPFAFTRVLSMWVDHEWLSGVVFYLIASICGDFGLIALRVALAVLATVCVVHASQRLAPERRYNFAWITLCLVHALAAWNSTVRCQAFTYLFIPVLYWAIIEYREHKHTLLLGLTPLIGIAWVNMHGGYALGCCVIGMFCLSQLIAQRLTLGLLAVAAGWAIAPFFTPYGFSVFVTFLLDSLSMVRPGIVEWEPLHSDPTSFTATLVLTLPLLYGIAVKRKQLDLFAIGALVFSAYCAFRHIRFLPFYMITAAIFGGPYIDATLTQVKNIRPSLYLATLRSGSAVVMGLLGVGALKLLLVVVSPTTYRLNFSDYPIGAIEWLRESGASGRLLVNFNHGSYALWRLYPNFKISVDGRYEEAYPEETVRDNALALNPKLPQSREALERINPTHILLSPFQGDSDPAAAFENGWKAIYHDENAAILSREGVDGTVPSSHSSQVPADMWTPRF